MTRVLEKDIENAVGKALNAWSREQDTPLLYLKLSVLGNRGYPDRMVVYQGHILFIEFKRPGEEPTKLQLYVHQLLRDLGHEVQVHDNADEAVAAIKAEMATKTGAGAGHEAHLRWTGRSAVLASGKRQDLGCAEVVSNTEEGGVR